MSLTESDGRNQPQAEEDSSRLYRRLLFAHSLSDRISRLVPGRLGVKLGSLVARGILPPFREAVLCPTLMGFDLLVAPGDGNAYYYEGVYEAGTIDIMRRCLRPGDVFIDAGASIGQMSLYASHLVGTSGRVFSFEPAPQRFAALMTSVERAGRTNVVAKQAALGETPGRLDLYLDLVSPSLIPRDLDTETERRTASADILRLDDVMSDAGCTEVRMMKIDVEGFELPLLRGAKALLESPTAPIICIEHERHGGDEMRPLHFLQGVNDYAFFKLIGRKERASKLRRLDDPSKARVGDNVFCLLPHHVADLEKNGVIAA